MPAAKMMPADFQQTLKNAGFDPGAIDGIWGAQTANAVEQWFADGAAIEVIAAGVPPPPNVISQVVPEAWMPECDMDRIIVHWTAGSHVVSENDRDHYHILVDGNEKLVRGTHSIKDNVSTGDNDYAAHTKGCNSKSIGISAAAMAGAIEQPFSSGKFPLQQGQWVMLARIAADLCREYNIAVTNQTVLQHGEVQANLGIAQSGKWDICKLPWEPLWTSRQVGNDFRQRVSNFL